ncbi:putative house-cleaning noncanonical NTP pyrophosphatase (MazG superfamily) [Streptomyces sp. PanSC19]|uniref:nucleoside triphosphate pyrophosphohydrolase n=1 Tax=Streptomyces sp. PanSC19 TaxID=1520455 RepID=UPI000F474E4A|nr:nucleoside triphosphate pyrophosphohydrolase [Streptomyces sp. PanSC19]ROQ26499.1 putative house-cleaning noncanonical NTP pyrophosphatase (MazG superfamily) [Streptomyces sp. PanSC19]
MSDTETTPGVGKLVRDRIPQIIRNDGTEEYRARLREKLSEEVAEFLDADDVSAPDELADVAEVLLALAADLGISPERLEAIRAAKAGERGGLAGRIVWTGNR